MVSTRRAAAERACAAAMAFSKLSGDEQGIILGQLRNTLEPSPSMYFSSASTELPPANALNLGTLPVGQDPASQKAFCAR